MTRLIRRALLATTAALAVIVLHGQPTTAGLLDLDDLTAAVFDSSTTQPSPEPAPIAALLDRTTSIVAAALDELGAAVPVLDQPLPAIPPPLVPPVLAPGGPPVPEPPAVEPDLGSPSPPIALPADGGGDGQPSVDPGGLTEPGPAPNPGPSDANPTAPSISGPADVEVTATGESTRRPSTLGAGRSPGLGVHQPAGAIDPSPIAADPVSLATGTTTSNLGPTATTSSHEPDIELGEQSLPVEPTEGWNPAASRGGDGVPVVAVGVALAAVAASSIVIAAVRRAISRRGRRADESVDREREPPGRASAEARPPRRVPPVRASADARPPARYPQVGRRRTPDHDGGNLDRVSADARSSGWAVTGGCRGPLRRGPPARQPSAHPARGSRSSLRGGRRPDNDGT